MSAHRIDLYCPYCSHTTRAARGTQCPMGHAVLRVSRGASHRRKPPTASDRAPVGAGSAEEPGSLWDSYEEASKQ